MIWGPKSCVRAPHSATEGPGLSGRALPAPNITPIPTSTGLGQAQTTETQQGARLCLAAVPGPSPGLASEGKEQNAGRGRGVKEKEHFSLKAQGAVILLPWSLRLGLLAFTLSDAQRALRGSCLKPENSKSWLSMSSFLPWEREEKESRNQTRAVTTVIFQRKART